MCNTSNSRYGMKRLARVTLAAWVLGVVGVARAGTLVSPPLALHIFTGQKLCCLVTNLDRVDRTGNMQIVGQTGTVVQSKAFTLPAGTTEDMCADGLVTGYCKFSISGKSKFLRASICVFDPDLGCISALEASRAPAKITFKTFPGFPSEQTPGIR